jgi:hypothetical protein
MYLAIKKALNLSQAYKYMKNPIKYGKTPTKNKSKFFLISTHYVYIHGMIVV